MYSGIELEKSDLCIGNYHDEMRVLSESSYHDTILLSSSSSLQNTRGKKTKSIIKKGKKRGRKSKCKNDENGNSINSGNLSTNLVNYSASPLFHNKKSFKNIISSLYVPKEYCNDRNNDYVYDDEYDNDDDDNDESPSPPHHPIQKKIKKSNDPQQYGDVEDNITKNIYDGGGGENEDQSYFIDRPTFINKSFIVQYHDNKGYWGDYYRNIQDDMNKIKHYFESAPLPLPLPSPDRVEYQEEIKIPIRAIITKEIESEISTEIRKIITFLWETQAYYYNNEYDNDNTTEEGGGGEEAVGYSSSMIMTKLCLYFNCIIKNIIILIYESPKMKKLIQTEEYQKKYGHLDSTNIIINNDKEDGGGGGDNLNNSGHRRPSSTNNRNTLSIRKICAGLLLNLFITKFYVADTVDNNIFIWDIDPWLSSIKVEGILDVAVRENKNKRKRFKFINEDIPYSYNAECVFYKTDITRWSNIIRSYILSYNASPFWLRKMIFDRNIII